MPLKRSAEFGGWVGGPALPFLPLYPRVHACNYLKYCAISMNNISPQMKESQRIMLLKKPTKPEGFDSHFVCLTNMNIYHVEKIVHVCICLFMISL